MRVVFYPFWVFSIKNYLPFRSRTCLQSADLAACNAPHSHSQNFLSFHSKKRDCMRALVRGKYPLLFSGVLPRCSYYIVDSQQRAYSSKQSSYEDKCAPSEF